MKRLLFFILFGVFGLQASVSAEVYLSPEDFIEQAFAGEPPEPEMLWLTGKRKDKVKAIMNHDLGQLRLRHWGREHRTAWILEEIGKEQPITTGIIVNDGNIERIQVLIFRESRGWEVKYPFFTEQFKGAQLTEDMQLSQPVDGISGATLSVNALKKLGRLALYLHTQTDYAR